MLLFWLYILSPELDLYRIGSSSVHIGDVIIIFLLLYVFYKISNSRIAAYRLRFVPVEFYLFQFFLLYALVSDIFILDNYFSLLFVVKQFELSMWFFVGLYFTNTGKFNKYVLASFVVLVMLYVAEYSGLYKFEGRFINSSRLYLTASGPYELAVILAFYLFFLGGWKNKIVVLAMMLMTKSRATFAAVGLIFLLYNKSRFRVFVLAAIGGLFVVFLFYFGHLEELALFRLDASFGLNEIMQSFADYYNAAPDNMTSSEYMQYTHGFNKGIYLNGLIDPSLDLRLFRWAALAKTTDIFNLIFGHGSGFVGLAIDSHYIRVLAEHGLVGLVLFLVFIYRAIRNKRFATDAISASYFFYALVIIFSATMIDIFYSEKAMSLLWLLLGLVMSKRVRHHENYSIG